MRDVLRNGYEPVTILMQYEFPVTWDIKFFLKRYIAPHVQRIAFLFVLTVSLAVDRTCRRGCPKALTKHSGRESSAGTAKTASNPLTHSHQFFDRYLVEFAGALLGRDQQCVGPVETNALGAFHTAERQPPYRAGEPVVTAGRCRFEQPHGVVCENRQAAPVGGRIRSGGTAAHVGITHGR